MLVAGAIIFLALVAMRSAKDVQCNDIIVTNQGTMVDSARKQEIFSIIGAYVNNSVTEMAVHDIPLIKLEEVLVNEDWIDDAYVFIDNTNSIRIELNSRQPIARIFDKNGSSYYLDQKARIFTGYHIKHNDLVLFTGLPNLSFKGSEDSSKALLTELVTVASAIAADSFWSAQVDQLEYAQQGYKMHPVIGNHMIWLGDSKDMSSKLERLKIFYKAVLADVGLHAFDVINVSYKGQVVVKKGKLETAEASSQVSDNLKKIVDRNKAIADNNSIASKNSAGRLMDTKPAESEESEPTKSKKKPKAIMPAKHNNN